MSQNTITYEPIGVIRTPFDSPEGMPIQPAGADATEGVVELEQTYADGLQDLDGFTHCLLLYHFHEVCEANEMQVEPFLDTEPRGLFATRAPARPNPIGLSVVEIDSVSGCEMTVAGIDVVDETPLLDIKPYVPAFDTPDGADTGWINASDSTIQKTQSDERFL